MTNIIIDDDGSLLSVEDICLRCDVSVTLITELVDLGVVEPQGREAAEWQFSVADYLRIRRAVRLQSDLGINEPGVALALDLLDELERMKTEIDHLQHHIFGDS